MNKLKAIKCVTIRHMRVTIRHKYTVIYPVTNQSSDKYYDVSWQQIEGSLISYAKNIANYKTKKEQV